MKTHTQCSYLPHGAVIDATKIEFLNYFTSTSHICHSLFHEKIENHGNGEAELLLIDVKGTLIENSSLRTRF